MLKSYVVSKDLNSIFLIFKDGSIQVWDMFNSEILYYFKHTEIPVSDVVDSQDGNLLYIFGHTGQLIEYNTRSGEVMRQV